MQRPSGFVRSNSFRSATLRVRGGKAEDVERNEERAGGALRLRSGVEVSLLLLSKRSD